MPCDRGEGGTPACGGRMGTTNVPTRLAQCGKRAVTPDKKRPGSRH